MNPAGFHRPSRLVLGGLAALIAVAGFLPMVGCGGRGREPPIAPADPRFLVRIDSHADFARLEGEQWAIKFLARVDGRDPPEPIDRPCTFQDTAAYPLHIEFLRTFPEFTTLSFDAYLALVMKRATRVAWAGELRVFPGARHPGSGRRGVIGLFVYAEPSEPLTPSELREIQQRVAGCAPYVADRLVLVGADEQQDAQFAADAKTLAAIGIAVASHAELSPRVEAEGYSIGEGYGYLRIVPPGASLPVDVGPRDILIAERASEEIGVVAGLVTALPQNVHSHLNLRLREKGIPNARVRSVFEDGTLRDLDGRVARLIVQAERAEIRPAMLEDAELFWKIRAPPFTLPPANLDERRVLPLSELRAADAGAYGTKAANLGELFHLLQDANRLPGFAVPYARYREFLADSGVEVRIEALLGDPRTKSDARFRRATLSELRGAIEAAPLAGTVVSELAAAAEAALGSGYATVPFKLRSSSNFEYGPRSSGAGLFDSARGCFADEFDGDDVGPSRCLSAEETAALGAELALRRGELAAYPERVWVAAMIRDLSADLTKERSVARALKKVYASLWSDRAFEERAYFSVEHADALMGVAINPSFVLERADAVAVTGLADGTGGLFHRLVSQVGGLPVVSPPDPTVAAETLTFRRGSANEPLDVRLLVASSLSPVPIWSDARLGELARLLFLVQDHFERQVYPSFNPLSLDFEVKLTQDDRIVIKQVRPYVQGNP